MVEQGKVALQRRVTVIVALYRKLWKRLPLYGAASDELEKAHLSAI